MSDEVTVTKAQFQAILRLARAEGWDAAVSSMIYDDGTSVEIAHNVNPYREDEE